MGAAPPSQAGLPLPLPVAIPPAPAGAVPSGVPLLSPAWRGRFVPGLRSLPPHPRTPPLLPRPVRYRRQYHSDLKKFMGYAMAKKDVWGVTMQVRCAVLLPRAGEAPAALPARRPPPNLHRRPCPPSAPALCVVQQLLDWMEKPVPFVFMNQFMAKYTCGQKGL